MNISFFRIYLVLLFSLSLLNAIGRFFEIITASTPVALLAAVKMSIGL